MNINEMLNDNSFLVAFEATSKKHLLNQLCKLANKNFNVDERVLLENLTKREKLGSTAVGNGIAIPHANVSKIEKPKVLVATLSKGLNFYAIDEQPVDVIFLLLAPNEKSSEHLQALALISRLLRNNELTSKLRGCKNAESAMMVLTQTDSEQAA
ncbi:PTS sugar transporter subunit IIA [Alphaproteobacteria bacterium]|nr:PTS sugar transporter subunit IIA [Alphaproteobacteria bacterium]